jgi:single-stranded DNA-binding protein
MNYSSFICKIITNPKQTLFENNISLSEFSAQFPRVRNRDCIDTFNVMVWGKLSYDIVKYYKINDYIIIEGYISLRSINSNSKLDSNYKYKKQVEITAFKVYPFSSNI